jgi:magnesium chelatase family protein
VYGRVAGVALIGVGGHRVVVEAFVGRGLPSLAFTGLPGATVQDGRERIRPAAEHAGLQWPLRRVVVNLAPANLRKDGPGLDLPIAIAVAAATAQVPSRSARDTAFFGELSLKGDVLSTPGVLSAAMAAASAGSGSLVCPAANAAEAAHVPDLRIVPVTTLAEAVGHLRGTWQAPAPPAPADEPDPSHGVDLADVRGQAQARRAIEIAAAGGHDLLMVGSPGAGKTMLARRLVTVLPPLDRDEALEATQIWSVAGLLAGRGVLRHRPFRAPHHSISTAGLLGGGTSVARPGEVSLAHRGLLFLDELTEFRRDAVESLRQPLEDGRIVVTRTAGSVSFPARFTLVAAANPCPCGYRGDPIRACRCRDDQRDRYRQKLSGPLLDRIDLRLAVPRLTKDELLGTRAGESSAVVRERVEAARARQRARYRALPVTCNAHVPGPSIRRFAALDDGAAAMLAGAVDRMALTGRGFDRVCKVARTSADLAGSDRVHAEHVAEALAYRTAFEHDDRERLRAAAG